MFEEFLEQYIKDLIECSCDEYEITEEEIKLAARNIESDEHLWNIVDNYVFNEIDKYIKEEE